MSGPGSGAVTLPAELVDFVEGGVSALVGTRDGQLRPAAMRAMGCIVAKDRTSLAVLLPELAGRRTIANLEAGSPIAVTFSRIVDHRTVQVKGSCLRVRPAGPAEQEATQRYQVEGATAGAIVDLRVVGGFPRGNLGAGSVHHVAFRAADDAAQEAMVRKLAENHGQRTTAQKNRDYFRSVYFREPGGVLFEIATDVPGFAVDEPQASLGQSLKLPAFLEPRRAELEAVLPQLA